MNKLDSYTLNGRLVSQKVASRPTLIYAPGKVEARERVRTRALSRQTTFPRWVFFVVLVFITFGFCVLLNLRSTLEVREEQRLQSVLQSEIKQLENGNMAIADEVRRLQSDPVTIERAARQRLNMVRENERVLVPAR